MPRAAAATESADLRRRVASAELDQDRRGDLGQFLTPADVARLMASMFKRLPRHVRLLEAGAGTGSLIAAFVEEACSRKSPPEALAVTAFEIDPVLLSHLHETLDHCRSSSASAGVTFHADIQPRDFIDAATSTLTGALYSDPVATFNAAILNPPYRKIATASLERRRLQNASLDATNLYAAFVALAIRLLDEGGQVVAIIPRSFCNGPYFRSFRDVLLDETTITRVHLFDSRSDAFKEDGVLQENVILHLVKGRRRSKTITVSSSTHAGGAVRSRVVPYEDVVRGANGDRFIHLPTNDTDDAVAIWMANLPATLEGLRICVSTGRVVDFRAREWLLAEPSGDSVPLVYPCHFDKGVVNWPKIGSRKANAIVHHEGSQDLLVPAGNYVLTKRFSSKEERRRVVASVFDSRRVSAEWVGFENHLNYYHNHGVGLERYLAYGLMAYLNSTPVDRYFRQFNGHTQVNATDLRALRYPDRACLVEFGRRASRATKRSQEDIDRLVLGRLPLDDS